MFKNLSKGIRILFVSQVMFLAYMSAVIIGSAMKRIEIAEVIFKNPLSGMTGTLGPGIFIMIWGVVMGMAGFILSGGFICVHGTRPGSNLCWEPL